MISRTLSIFFFMLTLQVSGQTGFTRDVTIPLDQSGPVSLPWAGGLNFPLFSEIDLNDDTLPDLFVFDRSNSRVLTFVNSGAGGIDCWQYAPQFESAFPPMRGWAFLKDYNCDSRMDIFTLNNRNNGIALYRNSSTPGNLQFTLMDTSVSYTNVGPIPANILASSNLVPDFNDIDGDGDIDIIGQQFMCLGGFAYYRNMSVEHTGNCDALDDYELDQNIWGSFTLRAGGYSNVIVGSFGVSCFLYSMISQNDFPYEVARRDDTYASLKTIDIDGDGDMDVLFGDSQADNSCLVINGGTPTHANMVSQDTAFPSYNVPIRIHSFAAHAFVDADNDGIKDLLVTQSEYENKTGVLFYKNSGTNSVPVFNYVMKDFLQGEMLDVGEAAAPVLFDVDKDGLLDLIIGNKYKTTSDTTQTVSLHYYRNTGTATAPSFELISEDYAGLQSLNLYGQIYPAFGDLDDDGDDDMLLGLDDGSIVQFTNTAGPGVSPVFSAPVYFYMSIDNGQACTPQLVDLNRDGLIDIVAGGKNGFVRYFQNTGTVTVPSFSNVPTEDTLGGIVVQTIQAPDGYSVPFVFEQSGQYRMLVSCMKGDIYLYGNIDGNVFGTYTVLDTVFTKIGGNRYGYNLTVGGGDINGDTLVDFVVGLYGGGVQFFMQDGPVGVSELERIPVVTVFPNPAVNRLAVRVDDANPFSVSLYDITGRRVFLNMRNRSFAEIDLTDFSEGVYLLRIDPWGVTQKVIILRTEN